MKKIICIALSIALCGCAELQNLSQDPAFIQAENALALSLLNNLPNATQQVVAKNYAQAFGDALRSLEGTEVSLIPGQIAALRAKWLPKGSIYSDFAANILNVYITQHPVNNADAQKVLEAIALGLQAK